MLISVSARTCALSSHNIVLGLVHVEHYTKMERVESSYLKHEESNIRYALTIRKLYI